MPALRSCCRITSSRQLCRIYKQVVVTEDWTANKIVKLPCVSASVSVSVSGSTASASASVSNPPASVLASVSASSALVTSLLQGHPRSLILAPIESAYMTSYSTSIITLVLSCRVSEILELLYAESRFFQHPIPIRAKISGCSPWSRPIMLGLQRANVPG